MGFMSLVFMGIYLIIMMAGALNILIAVIIFLVRFIKKRKNKRVGSISKVLAILLLSLGILAEMPAVIGWIHMSVEEVREKQEYENLENKVLIETNGLQDEFEYKGETLVKVEELENSSWADYDEEEASFIANLVFNDSDETYEYAEMRKTTNNSGYDIYIVDQVVYYVKKEDKQKVIEYYKSEAECIAEVQRDSYDEVDPETDDVPSDSSDWVDLKIDLQKIQDIIANSKTEDKRASLEKKIYYHLEMNSVDYIWGDSYTFVFFDDCAFFEPEDNGTIIKGYLMSKEDEAYIREIFEKAIADSQS